MEFLKEIFGGGALTYEQLAAKVAEKKMKDVYKRQIPYSL